MLSEATQEAPASLRTITAPHSGSVPRAARAEFTPAPCVSHGPVSPASGAEQRRGQRQPGRWHLNIPRGRAAFLANAGRMDLAECNSDSWSCTTNVTTLLSPGNFPGLGQLLSAWVLRLDALKCSQPQQRVRGDSRAAGRVELQGGLMGPAPAWGHHSTSQA